jgi:hypothetical protein
LLRLPFKRLLAGLLFQVQQSIGLRSGDFYESAAMACNNLRPGSSSWLGRRFLSLNQGGSWRHEPHPLSHCIRGQQQHHPQGRVEHGWEPPHGPSPRPDLYQAWECSEPVRRKGAANPLSGRVHHTAVEIMHGGCHHLAVEAPDRRTQKIRKECSCRILRGERRIVRCRESGDEN